MTANMSILSLAPRFLADREVRLGIVPLKGAEFYTVVDIYDRADLASFTPTLAAETAALLAQIAAGDSRRVPSVSPGQYKYVLVEGVFPYWLLPALAVELWRRDIDIVIERGGAIHVLPRIRAINE